MHLQLEFVTLGLTEALLTAYRTESLKLLTKRPIITLVLKVVEILAYQRVFAVTPHSRVEIDILKIIHDRTVQRTSAPYRSHRGN